MRPSSSGVTRACTRPRHTGPRTLPFPLGPLPALLSALLVVTAACSGLGGPDTGAPAVEIRIQTPADGPDGASIEVAGLTAEDLARLLKGISAHSTRIGPNQDLFASGEDLAGIMDALRWKSPRMPLAYNRNLAAEQGAAGRLMAKIG